MVSGGSILLQDGWANVVRKIRTDGHKVPEHKVGDKPSGTRKGWWVGFL